MHLSRLLLSGSDSDCDSDHDSHSTDETFNHIYYVMIYVAALWIAGKLATKLAMPALVGEIVFGIILGPHLVNLAGDEGSEFLIVIGEIGLVMLVVEAGIDVDVGMLKLIGPRGVGIALLGSIFPMSMGFCITYLGMGTDIMSSIAIGACFAPTSMGIALNVLKKARILNTPTGQLIIAAAILDDVLALIILTEIQALSDPTVMAILLPLIVSPVLIIIIGYLAIRWIPIWMKKLMDRVPKENRENVILALLFLATFAFVPMVHYLGSSHLLGAFLAGLCFCTDHTIHHAWHHQIKRVLQWMLRIFFSATIGFQIPILEFGSPMVLLRGFVFCFAAIGKVVQGFFAQPLNPKEFFIVGFSMSAWGEFAFILATTSYAEGTMDKESFSAVLLAVLLSVILSPYGLSFTISYYEKQAQKKMDESLAAYENQNVHPLYFAINTKSRGSWGQNDKLLKAVFDLNLEIVDFRSWHAPEFNYTHDQPLTKQSFYVQDLTTLLPPTRHLNEQEKTHLLSRVASIKEQVLAVLGQDAVVSMKRWLPGVTQREDKLAPNDSYLKAMFGGDFKPKSTKTPEYCRNAAFKQAHSIMSVLERKATIEDLKRASSKQLPGMTELQRQSSIKQLEREIGKAGGAGALRYTDAGINLDDHFKDEDGDGGKKREMSHMSYIYGDEDSQVHKLPEYSVTKSPNLVPTTPAFQPTMPKLHEEHDDDAEESQHGNDAVEASVSVQDVDQRRVAPSSVQMSGISNRSPSQHMPVPSGSMGGDDAVFNI